MIQKDKMKVLVTGACGFIGTNLCETLLDEGHEVIGIDDFSGYYPKETYKKNEQIFGRPNATLIKGSILDEKKLSKLKGKNITHIVHLAAKAGVRDSTIYPELYFETNIIGTYKILRLGLEEKVKSIALASTSSVYGINPTPSNELMPTNTPLSFYASSKVSMEAIAYSFYHLYGLPVNVLRFFSVYGPRGRHDMAVYKFSKAIMENKPITIFGDGTQKRDFTYIDDTVSGIISSLSMDSGFNVFNLGCSRTVTVNHLVEVIENLLGKKSVKKFAEPNSADVFETFSDTSKAKKILGYSPKTGIEKGIENFLHWYRANK
ncbi:MAG: hypothetical protein COV47_06315 [Candidatus Diapherotrites archaeon CG11_big_fil_rev_8_21_14_0_20_37_9]|nr:MAG: hypothetical protein COV47_06315 [Candidatus Diapherotrites archaeon CG11_big_fil_rev_8_21_14_0_20_37_9]